MLSNTFLTFVYLRVAVLMYMQNAHGAEPHEAEPEATPEAAPSRCPPAQRVGPPAAAVYAALAIAALVTVIGGIFPDSLMFWAVAP